MREHTTPRDEWLEFTVYRGIYRDPSYPHPEQAMTLKRNSLRQMARSIVRYDRSIEDKEGAA